MNLLSEAQLNVRRFQPLADVVEWADANYRVMNPDSEYFDSKESPWLIEPLRAADDPLVSTLTLVKPVQTGGTSLGEIIAFRKILSGRLLIHYNWPTDEKAIDRWKKFTERRIKACGAVAALMPTVYQDCFIKFLNDAVFAMQGVHTSGNLDSDTVDLVINEEVHQWNPGMIAKARGRQTRVMFPKFITISNSGLAGSDLHTEFNNGTQQHYQVKCPGCGGYHIMRTRWEDSRQDLGGLRYDSEGCKRPDGTFDYNKLLPTIRFQMPCGYEMHDNQKERRAAALDGQYAPPKNTGALSSNRSYTYEAVCCHNIRWLDLIQQKHAARRASNAGDQEAWRIYLQERESIFYDPNEHRPPSFNILINHDISKNREGLPGRAFRGWAADKQKGVRARGQLKHYWLGIRDVMENCDSRLIFEGKIDSDNELLAVLAEHECKPWCGGIDGSWDTEEVKEFCYRNGFNVFMANSSHKVSFLHADKVRRFYSDGPFLFQEMGIAPKYEFVDRPSPREPVIYNYNVAGLLANLFYLRNHEQICKANNIPEFIRWEVPSDVSEDYKNQLDSWEEVPVSSSNKNVVGGFRPRHDNDHLTMVEGYIALEMKIDGYIDKRKSELGL